MKIEVIIRNETEGAQNTLDSLHRSLSETLELFVRKGRKSAREVSESLNIDPPVAHGRLEKLRRRGLVDRENKGNGFRYFKTSAK